MLRRPVRRELLLVFLEVLPWSAKRGHVNPLGYKATSDICQNKIREGVIRLPTRK